MKVSQIYENYTPVYMYITFNSGTIMDVYAYTSKNYGLREKTTSKSTRTSMKLGINQLLLKIKTYCDDGEASILTSKLKPILVKLGKAGDRTYNKMLNWRTYDLWKEIDEHDFKKKGNPASNALEWYKKLISKNAEYFFKAKLLRQGFLYTYNYDTPKFESVLDFFDTSPLIISFGPIETSLGKRDIGINMHLYPPRIRRIILYKVFEMYRNLYKEQLFAKKPATVNVNWKQIAKPLEKYGVAFGVRMYIPELRKNVIEFRYEDWASAIYLPSKKLAKTTQTELEKLWKEFVVNQRNTKGAGKGLNESWQNS